MKRFDESFFRGGEYLVEQAARTWGRRFLGRPVDLRKGGGTEVSGISDYMSGHDYRYVDWNRCARHDELVSKQFGGSELNHVHLLVDCSASMRIGQPSKLDFACRLAGMLGLMALANQDSVHLGTFADQLSPMHPAVRGRHRLPTILQFLDELQPAGSKSLAHSLTSFAKTELPRGIVVIVSDLLDPDQGLGNGLDMLRSRGFTPYVVHLFDPSDQDPSWTGKLKLTDASTGDVWRVTLDDRDLENYRRVFAEFTEAIHEFCRHHQIGLLQTRTDATLQSCIEFMMHSATWQYQHSSQQTLVR